MDTRMYYSQGDTFSEEEQSVMDPIHSHIKFPKLFWQIIDTPEFQRLRSIRALGCAVFVFHNANHTVFEHSLGVAYLSRKLIKRLNKDQPDLDINVNDIQNVTIAGLCHDLAAGPYTNAFKRFMQKFEQTKCSKNWSSTPLAIKLLNQVIESQKIKLEPGDMDTIAKIISGKCSELKEKQWIGDIVLNQRNMIDTDLFDSINRDTHKLGLFYSSFDSYPLYAGARVIDNEICYPVKVDIANPTIIIIGRPESIRAIQLYNLIKQIYSHNKIIAFELMLSDIFMAADPVYKFQEKFANPEEYIQLTDNILYEIEISQDPELEKARRLIKRLRAREIYKCVGEIIVPESHITKLSEITPAQILECQLDESDEKLKEEDLELHIMPIEYAKGKNRPLDYVKFYRHKTDKSAIAVDEKKVSLISPAKLRETYVRLYAKEKVKAAAARKVFAKYAEEKLGIKEKPLHIK